MRRLLEYLWSLIMALRLRLRGGSSGGGGGGSDTLVDAGRIVMNDSGSTLAQTMEHKLVVQFADGVVASTDDLVVKMSSTEFTTQVREMTPYASGCMSIGVVSFLIPSGTMLNGSNSVDIYKRAGTRSTTSAITLAAIAAQNITVEFTSVRDHGGTADGSGTFVATLATYVEAGEPACTILDRGPVCLSGRCRVVAHDTTGGAAHAAGLKAIIDFTAVQVSGALSFTRFRARAVMGDRANGDPDVRRYDVVVKVNGVAVTGGTHTGQYAPYYSDPVLSRADGRQFCTDATKHSPLRNVLPFATWSIGKAKGGIGRLMPYRATKLNSGAAIATVTDLAEAQTIPTSGGDQGKITLANYHLWRANSGGSDLPGGNWVRFVSTVQPTGVSDDTAYCLGAELSGGKFYVYPTRADAIADTNKVIPSTGGISAGTGVVVYPAHSPMSMPMGDRGWGTGGERSELGVMSSIAWAAIMQPNRAMMDALRCNALNLAYVPFNYRDATTKKIPNIHTGTYSGLGSAEGTTFTQDNRFGGPFGMVNPTNRDSANWYEDTRAGIGIDNNHPPAPDYFAAWLHEPETDLEDIALFWFVGCVTWGLAGDRCPTWNSVQIVNSTFGAFFDNVRARAWKMRALTAAHAMWPAAVIVGNNGERSMLTDIVAAQDTQATEMLSYSVANTPNAYGMGLLPMQMGAGLPNWQYMGYFVAATGQLNAYDPGGVLSGLLTAMKPFGKAHGGNVGAATGTMGPTRGGTYYVGCRSFVSSGLYDAPAAQWNAYGVSDSQAFMSINTGAATVTLTALPGNIPDDFPRAVDNDLFTCLKSDTGAVVDTAIGFDTPRYLKNVSIDGSGNPTFQLSATPGGAALNLTSATVTNVLWSLHRASEATYGFVNTQISNLYPTQVLGGVYVLSWALGGMDTEVTAANSALANQLGVATEHSIGATDAKYAYDLAICKEAA